MRKFLIFISCVTFALLVSSCKKDALTIEPNTLDNRTGKCWYVTVSQSNAGINTSNSWYEYSTERALVISLQKNKDIPGYSATYKEITKYADSFSCVGANEKEK